MEYLSDETDLRSLSFGTEDDMKRLGEAIVDLEHGTIYKYKTALDELIGLYEEKLRSGIENIGLYDSLVDLIADSLALSELNSAEKELSMQDSGAHILFSHYRLENARKKPDSDDIFFSYREVSDDSRCIISVMTPIDKKKRNYSFRLHHEAGSGCYYRSDNIDILAHDIGLGLKGHMLSDDELADDIMKLPYMLKRLPDAFISLSRDLLNPVSEKINLEIEKLDELSY
ncbi:MAG: hypothetical protein ACLFNK_05535 [Candidatus Woesearchaeota archaeon]